MVESPTPRGGQYPVSIISLSLKLVLNAGSSLRGAGAAMAQFVRHEFAFFCGDTSRHHVGAARALNRVISGISQLLGVE